MEQDVFLEDLLAATIRDQLVTFIAFVNVSASEQVVLDLGVYNGGNDVPANEAFNGVWRLEHKEGTVRAAGIVHTLPRLPGGQEEMLIQWTGALAPGSYQLTWGAPGYGTTVVGFDVKEVDGHLQIGDQEISNATSDPPAGLLDGVETTAPPAGE
jgi:hypothetical protein